MPIANYFPTAKKRSAYWRLMRADRPIGTLLLLWPTLIALWLAAEGHPQFRIIVIFTLGTFLMRSAGCVINDYFDQKVDGHVERTKTRPIVSGEVTPKEALVLFFSLLSAAFILVLFTNTLTILLSLVAASIAISYPLMKRITQLPQFVLGLAFSAGIPMAFAAQLQTILSTAWWLLVANLLWTVAYDTFYAMVDREDDLKIGVKSSAILFGRYDRLITALLQLSCLITLLIIGKLNVLHWPFYTSLFISAGLFAYQQALIQERQREPCFAAFLHNNWVGFCWFSGIVIDYLLYPIGL